MGKIKELFHIYSNEDMTINCYYLPDQEPGFDHEIVCEYTNGHEPSTLTTNSRQACIALCVNIEDGYRLEKS